MVNPSFRTFVGSRRDSVATLDILNVCSSGKDLIVHRPKFLLLIMFVCLDWRTTFFFTPHNRASVIVWYKKGNIVADVVEKGVGKAAKTVLLPIVNCLSHLGSPKV
jgi:hypothetical protein